MIYHQNEKFILSNFNFPQSFVHVSTAYANCNLADIDEVHYEMGEKYDPLKLLELCE